jgi:hypothetical protein
MLRGEYSALFESPNDLLSVRQFLDAVARSRMSFHWQDLAIDSKAANVVSRAVSQRCQQSICVLKTQTTQFRQRVCAIHSTNGRNGRVGKLDWLLLKHAAETEANHGLPQFMIVIDNCSTVASDTQIK